MRGGISYIAKRFSKANNKYMKCYDDSKSSKYIEMLCCCPAGSVLLHGEKVPL